jgi:hypothetical protein
MAQCRYKKGISQDFFRWGVKINNQYLFHNDVWGDTRREIENTGKIDYGFLFDCGKSCRKQKSPLIRGFCPFAMCIFQGPASIRIVQRLCPLAATSMTHNGAQGMATVFSVR